MANNCVKITSTAGISAAGSLSANGNGGDPNYFACNVGIGTNVPSANGSKTTLHINSDTNGAAIRLSQASNSSLIRYNNANGLEVGTIASKNLSFETADTTAMTIDTSQNVGIGTSTPSAKFHIQGHGSTGGLRIDNGSGGSDNVNFYHADGGNDSDFFITYQGTGGAEITLKADGDTLLNASNGDNVGIGTSSPAEKLTVDGNISASGSLSAAGSDPNYFDGNVGIGTNVPKPTTGSRKALHVKDTSNGVEMRAEGSGSTVNIKALTDGYVGTQGADTFHIQTNNQNQISICPNGKVGISTSDPVSSLHVAGSVYISDNTTIMGNLSVHGDQTFIDTHISTTSALSVVNAGTGPALTVKQDGSQPIAHFIDFDGDDIVFDDNGRVGIGTYSPTDYNANADDLVIKRTGHAGITIASGTSQDGNLYFADGTSGSEPYRGWVRYRHADDALTFGTEGAEKIRVCSDGDVGIGTTTPTADTKLDVAGSAIIQGSSNRGLSATCADSINYFAGTVGIGTTTPPQELSVKGEITTLNTSGIQVVTMQRSSNHGQFIINDSGGNNKVCLRSDGNNVFLCPVNIGSTTASGALNVATSCQLRLGDGDNFRIFHNGTSNRVESHGGNIIFYQYDHGDDIAFCAENSSGTVHEYYRIDSSAETNLFKRDVTVGVDGTGHDVIFYGDTASAYLQWDQSEDTLKTAGGAFVDIVKDKLKIGGTAVTTTAAELNLLDGLGSIPGACCEGTVTSIGTGTGLNGGTITNSGTIAVDAAQTGITSILATDLKIGEDDQTKIDFETADEIHFYAANAEQVYVADGVFGPQTDSDVDLGTNSVRWKHGHFDDITVNDNLIINTSLFCSCNTTDASSSSTGAARFLGGVGIAKKLYVGTDLDVDGTTNLDAVDIDGNVQVDGTLCVGSDGTGYDVKFFGDASGEYMQWDTSEAKLKIVHTDESVGLEVYTNAAEQSSQPQLKVGRGTNQYYGVVVNDRCANIIHRQDETSGSMETRFLQWDSNTSDTNATWKWMHGNGSGGSLATAMTLSQGGNLTLPGNIDVDGTTNLDAVDIDGAVQIDNTINVGADDTGYDVKFFGDTASAYMLWDASADDLILGGAAGLCVAGNADIDGTLEADAITVGGTALNTVIAGVTVTNAQNATNSCNLNIADNESTDENDLIPFIADAGSTGNVALESDGDFHYNPSTGTVTATIFKGNIDAVDGDFDGTLEADAITVGGATLASVIEGTTVTNATNATNAAHVCITDNESTNEENQIAFVENAAGGTANRGLEADGDFTYNPSSGTVTATVFKGNIDAVDGDFDGTLEADAITVGGTALNTVIAGVTVTNAQNATNSCKLNIADNESTDENDLIPFIADAGSTGNVALESDGDFHYNPSTGTVTATVFSGNFSGCITQASQTNITSLGTLTTLTVDDITINDSTISDAGDLTIDAGGDIILDADGTDIILKDGGTEFGSFKRVSSDFVIKSATSNKDILFKGNDDGATITALTLDMSNAGMACFNNTIHTGGNICIENGGPKLCLIDSTDDDDHSIQFVNNTGAVDYEIRTTDPTSGGGADGFYIGSCQSDGEVVIFTNDTHALTLSPTQKATFADEVCMGNSKLVLNGTAVDATAAELNLLDGKSSLVTCVGGGDGLTGSVTSSGNLAVGAGTGITVNANDVAVTAAQTGITSILATDLKIGEDDQTKIDFETADEIHFYAANAEQVYVSDGVFGPETDSDVDLGTSSARWKSGHLDNITVVSNSTLNDVSVGNLDVETGLFCVCTATDASSSSTGAARFLGGVGIAKKLYVGTDLDVDGTTNLDAVDIDGNVQLDGTLTVGVNDTGYDVKFYGATADRFLRWVQSEDRLKLTDNTRLSLGGGNDLQLYHDGSHSYIKDIGDGGLYLQTDGPAIYLQDTDGNAMAQFTDGGSSFLMHNGSTMLNTDASGTVVTGRLCVTGGNTSLQLNPAGSGNCTILTGCNCSVTDSGVLRIGIPSGGGAFSNGAALGDVVIRNETTSGDLILTSVSGEVHLGSGGTDGDTQLKITDGAILPVADDSIDLGSSSNEFKDAYFDGTVTADGLSVVADATITGSLVVDDMTFNGSNITDAGDFYIDVGGDINLDAAGNNICLLADGTNFADLFKSSDHFFLKNPILNGDIKFQVNDGGSGITALTIDGSDAGTATFNNNVCVTGMVRQAVGISCNTADYTLALADHGKLVEMNKSSAVCVTIPPNSSVAFPVGAEVTLFQGGAGQVTILAGSGVTARSADNELKTRVQYSTAVLTKIATDEWLIAGDLTA